EDDVIHPDCDAIFSTDCFRDLTEIPQSDRQAQTTATWPNSQGLPLDRSGRYRPDRNIGYLPSQPRTAPRDGISALVPL
ncbi:hypothetical protein BV898_10891, partial [Hypsibius exemplaris]